MFFADDIGIDLGTASVLIYKRGGGIILKEPSVVAIDLHTHKVIAIGEEARRMLGRTPSYITAVRPLREGVIADYDTTEKMLSYFIHKVCNGIFFFKPRVIVCIPTGATDVEERAVREATLAAGARQAFIIEEPLAAALGAGLDITGAGGNMVIDIGGGTSDIAVLSLGGMVRNTSLRVGGDKFDEAIIRYVRRENKLMIGERTAEDIKIRIGTAFLTADNRDQSMDIRGRDLISGLPKTVTVTSEDIWEAMREPIDAVVESVKKVLEITPPELAADIVDNGILMTGGGALLNGLDRLIAQEAQLPVHVAEDPISCVARGTGIALSQLHIITKTNKNKTLRRVL
jgi:rod shape-determining protein MreB